MSSGLPSHRKEIGRVISAEWNEKTNAIDFVVKFHANGYEVHGSLPSGYDAKSGVYASRTALRARVDKIRKMVVYDNTGRMNVAKMTPEQMARLTLSMSLSGAGITATAKPQAPTMNSFISRLLK